MFAVSSARIQDGQMFRGFHTPNKHGPEFALSVLSA
jgi:hypothetical protein